MKVAPFLGGATSNRKGLTGTGTGFVEKGSMDLFACHTGSVWETPLPPKRTHPSWEKRNITRSYPISPARRQDRHGSTMMDDDLSDASQGGAKAFGGQGNVDVNVLVHKLDDAFHTAATAQK